CSLCVSALRVAHPRISCLFLSYFLSFFFFFSRSFVPRDPHSFPTRRSSDLASIIIQSSHVVRPQASPLMGASLALAACIGLEARSEEHTSELQSRFELVCRLLLEKKNSTTRPSSSCEVLTGW